MKKQIIALLLLCSIAVTAMVSCKNTSDDGKSTTDAGTNGVTTGTLETEAYTYPELDMNGEDYTVLNMEDIWYYTMHFDVEKAEADAIDTVLYERNRFIEDKFKTTIKEVKVNIDSVKSTAMTAISVNEDAYDLVYCFGSFLEPQYLIDLNDLEGLQLSEDWWDHSSDNFNIGGTYWAQNYSTLTAFDSATVACFNKRIQEEYKIEESIYDLVKNKQWTLDKMKELVTATSSLNGQEDYTYSPDGSAQYGLTTWGATYRPFMLAGGANIVEKADDKIVFVGDNEHFFEVAEKVAAISGLDGYLDINLKGISTTFKGESHETIFRSGRAFLLTAELKSTSIFRNMNDDYGVIPMPLYNEQQADYITFANGCPIMMPITNANAEDAAVVTDAIAYYSYANLLPTYYDVVLSEKHLRDDESKEMLEVIRKSITLDFMTIYGSWSDDIWGKLNEDLRIGSAGAVTSIIAGQKELIEYNISNYLSKIK